MLGNPRTWFSGAFIAFILGVVMICAGGGQGWGPRWVGEDPDSGTYDPATSQPNDGSSWWQGGSGTSDNGWWGDSGSWDSGGSDSGSWDSGGSDSGSWDSGGSDSGSWDSGGSDGGTWDDGGSDSGSW
jgi:hypothetical protein